MTSNSSDSWKAFEAIKACGVSEGSTSAALPPRCACKAPAPSPVVPVVECAPPPPAQESCTPPPVQDCCKPPPPPPPPQPECCIPPPPLPDCPPDVVEVKPETPPQPSGLAGLLPKGYGFVVITAVGSIMMVTWKSMKVGIARDEHKIPYPQMYSPDNIAFNCVVRAHQNTMESYPQFLLCLMIGGLEMPYFCAVGGWIWILGRIMYAKGYYSGDPSKRARGTMSLVGMLMLITATIKFAVKHIRG